MRDKNLTLQQFNIQLEKQISRQLSGVKLLRTTVSDSPKVLDDSEFLVQLPRKFKDLRALAIVLWSFPEKLKWRILLDLGDEDFDRLNDKQKLELSILLSSKEICYLYLFETERYSSRELFGNILGNECKNCLQKLKIRRSRKRKPRFQQRIRGYRDKGGRRPEHQWLERFDFSLSEYQLQLEKKRYLQSKYSSILLQLLTEKLITFKRREFETEDSHLCFDERD